MLILVIYYKKFDSDCQSHSDDSINLKGLSVLKTSPFLFISRSFFIRTISIQCMYVCMYVPIHIRNLQLLMTEIYKTKWELNPSFMKEIFVEKHSPYGIRSCDNLQLPQARTTCNGLDTISFRGCRLWQALPNDIKQSNTLSSFNRRIKLWKGESIWSLLGIASCFLKIALPVISESL